MTYSDLWHQLTPLYEPREAQAIVRTVLDTRFHLSLTDIVCGKVNELSSSEQEQLLKIMKQLITGVPVQYALGYAPFCGRQFKVAPGVLIPRPETEILCKKIEDDYNQPYCGLQPPKPTRILDIGTGSGCIAITLAHDVYNSEVTAWDISSDALLIARDNAHALDAKINLELQDIFDIENQKKENGHYDIIVSNPPYICEKERKDMAPHVLEHEPEIALFVPDNNPLLFYTQISLFAMENLVEGGQLYFEANPIYIEDIAKFAKKMQYRNISIFSDQFDKKRFLRCQKPFTL